MQIGLKVKFVRESFLTKSFGMDKIIYLGGLISNIYMNYWEFNMNFQFNYYIYNIIKIRILKLTK